MSKSVSITHSVFGSFNGSLQFRRELADSLFSRSSVFIIAFAAPPYCTARAKPSRIVGTCTERPQNQWLSGDLKKSDEFEDELLSCESRHRFDTASNRRHSMRDRVSSELKSAVSSLMVLAIAAGFPRGETPV